MINDVKALRQAFGAYITGVTVVTALDENGVPVGFTANSFTSVSLDPPLLLVCPALKLSCYPVFAKAKRFAISILAEGQEHVSNIFASSKGDRFAQVDWHPDRQGVPIISNNAVSFSCAVENIVEAGDHAVLIGKIDAFTGSKSRGLGYMSGNYFSLALEQKVETQNKSGSDTYAGVITSFTDQVLLQETPDGLALPKVKLEQRTDSVRRSLIDHLKSANLQFDLGAVYSVFENKQDQTMYTYFLASNNDFDPAGLGKFVPIHTLHLLKFASSTEAQILSRFAKEHSSRHFNLYFGDEITGNLHDLKGK